MSDDRKPGISRGDFLKLAGGAVGVGIFSYFLGLRDQPRTSAANDAPDYIDSGSGFPVFRGPYLQKDARLSAVLYPAKMDALTRLCDQTLNAVPNAPYRYIPLMDNVLLVHAEMLVSSMDERDAQVGLIPETEAGFWVLTVAMQKTSGGDVPHHLAWFLPELFVDEGNAIATGREVYGFNKRAGAFSTLDNKTPGFGLDVLGFERFAPDAIAQKQRLLEIHAPILQTSATQWNDWDTAKSELASQALPLARTDQGEGLLEFAAQSALKDVPLAFVKQLRHAADTRKASYQALVEAPLSIQAFHGGGMFDQPVELKIHALESHPLMQKLGLKENQASALGAWLNVDFVLGNGVEYSRA